MKKRVATLAEKERLENSPISELIVDCLLNIPDTKKWNKFDKQLKLTDLDIQFLKLEEVMNIVIKQEHFNQILNDEIEEVTRKVSKAAGERFKSLQHSGYLESSNNSPNHYPFNISNKMMLLTIDVDLLSFPPENSLANNKQFSSHSYYSNVYHPHLRNHSSVSNSESNTPNNTKPNKNDTPYRNGFKKSFIKYQQKLSSLAQNNGSSTNVNDLKPLQSTYQKSADKIIHHLPIQIKKSDHRNPNISPVTSPSYKNKTYTAKDYSIIPELQQPLLPSSNDNKSSENNSSSSTVNTYIHKIEKISKALPLKAKFKLASKESI